MKIGFTGTQDGMTEQQKDFIRNLFKVRIFGDNLSFHHGNCIGADDDFHTIIEESIEFITFTGDPAIENAEIIVHPPLIKDKEASGDDRTIAGTMLEAKDYLPRNKDIVNATEVLIATPNTYDEVLRSGTWSTVRYARKQGKMVYVIYPDGTGGLED